MISIFNSKDLVYDLGDPARWEFMFPGSDKPLLMLPTSDDEPLDLDDDEDEEEQSDFDLPPSWVLPIEISLKGWFLYKFQIHELITVFFLKFV